MLQLKSLLFTIFVQISSYSSKSYQWCPWSVLVCKCTVSVYTQFRSNRLYHPHSTASSKDAHRTNKEIQSNNRSSRRNMIILTSHSQSSSLRQSTGERKVRQGRREGDERSALIFVLSTFIESFVKANSWWWTGPHVSAKGLHNPESEITFSEI